MKNITAYAALANAALLLSVVAVFAFLPMGPVWSGHTAAFVILAGPLPLAITIAAWGLAMHPATSNMRTMAGLGAVLLVIAAVFMCLGALVALDVIRRQDTTTWAFLPSFLVLFPIFILGGLGALCIAPRSFTESKEPNWLALLGGVTAVAGVCIAGGPTPMLIAAAAFVLWWALLAAMLWLYKPSGATLQ
ncbi:MAG: hypothetical protein R3C30_15580 [Hyphomonadaceae bacterium]